MRVSRWSPVLRLRSQRGKQLFVTCTRMPVAGEEHVARRPQVDLDLAALVGAAVDAEDAVAEVERSAVGVDVAQARDPVGRRRRALDVQPHADPPGHLEVLLAAASDVKTRTSARSSMRAWSTGPRASGRRHERSAVRGHRVGRVVVDLARRCASAAGDAVLSAAVGVQVPALGPGALQRPGRLVAPLVASHDEQPHGRRVARAGASSTRWRRRNASTSSLQSPCG